MQKGTKQTESAKLLISRNRKGKGIGNTYGTANRGRIVSDEQRAKQSASMKAAHAKRKGQQQ
jgi:hypothetical protein